MNCVGSLVSRHIPLIAVQAMYHQFLKKNLTHQIEHALFKVTVTKTDS